MDQATPDACDRPEAARALVLEDIVEALEEGLILWDSELRFVTSNAAHRAFFGEDAVPRPGESAYDVMLRGARAGVFALPPGTTPEAMAEATVGLLRAHAKGVEFPMSDGRIFVGSVSPTRQGGYVATFREVTAQRMAEALRPAFAHYDARLRLVQANAAHDRLVGCTPEDRPIGASFDEIAATMIGRGLVRVPEGLDAEGYAGRLRALVLGGTPGTEVETGDGRILSAAADPAPGGGHLVTLQDVTERERAAGVLEDFIQSVDRGLILFDADWRLVRANRAYQEMVRPFAGPLLTGEPADAITERLKAGGFYAVPQGPALDAFVAGLFEAAGEAPGGGPVEIGLADGRRLHARRHRAPSGGYLLSFEDVTERLAAEERARAVLVETIEALDEGVALYDAELRFVLANRRFHDLFFRTIAPPRPGEPARTTLRRQLDGGHYALPEGLSADPDAAFEAILSIAVGHQRGRQVGFADGRTVMASALPTDQGGTLFVFQEITEQLEADARARGALLEIVEALDEGVALYDSEFRFVLGNRRFHDLFFRKVAPAVPGEPAAVAVRRLLEAGHYDIPEGLPDDLDEAVELILGFGYDHDRERLMHFADGRSVVGDVLPTDQGGYLLVLQEVTERLAMEEELARERDASHQSEKMSALGELLAGVAHELNNPLSVVSGYATMLEEDVAGEAREMAVRIGSAAERCARIVRMFLAMARQRPMRTERCALEDVVEVALDVGGYGLRSAGVTIERRFEPDLPPVEVDPDQIAQVLSNLLVNAEHAVAGRPDPRVSVSAARRGGEVVLEVSDNGPGVPEGLRPRIFEPFFTTKEVGGGTGIGLAFAHRIVASHGGALTLGDGGEGATFRVALPAAPKTAAIASAPSAPVVGTGRRVLVVDDEADVAEMLARMLTRRGLVARTATGGREALVLAAAERFDAVVSDMKMPCMSGEALHAELARLDPTLAARTVFMTGDALTARVRDFLARSGRPHVEKPVAAADLIECLAEVLKSPPLE